MQLLHGDCLEIMKDIPDGSIDMVLCDPPYGTTSRNQWDAVIDPAAMWAQYKRVIKSGGAICLFSQQPFASTLIQSNPRWFRYEWIWEKTEATGFLNANRMPMRAHENILVFYDKLPTYNPQKVQGEPYKRRNRGTCTNYGEFERIDKDNKGGERFPRDVIRFPRVQRGVHPTQKPVPLLEYFIKTYTNAGETVLDNCMGSGSTGIACVNTGRDFIGIEKDKGYFDIAVNRIEEAAHTLLLPC